MSPLNLAGSLGEPELNEALAALLEQSGLEPWLPEAPGAAALDLGAAVGIRGAQSGSVRLQMDEALARRLTQALFGPEAPAGEELQDSVGEMTNIVAGHLKAALRDEAKLSLPQARSRGVRWDETGPVLQLRSPWGCLRLSVAGPLN
jgi:hypothetical protein